MIYGLKVDNCTVKDSVLKMFRECGVEGISSSADNVVSEPPMLLVHMMPTLPYEW